MNAKGDLAEAVVTVKPFHPSSSARIIGDSPLAATSNYFLGNRPENWHTDIPSFARVRLSNVYPGVDLVYYGDRRNLEYDFIAQPNSDTTRLILQIGGASQVEFRKSGDLAIHTAVGQIVWRKPVAYQETGGRRKTVECGFVRKSDVLVGFRIGSYDHSQPLTIDPVIEYSTFLGGSGTYDFHTGRTSGDFGNSVAVDPQGNVYVTGSTSSFDFPVKGAYQSSSPVKAFAGRVAYISKFSATGLLVYSTYLGGSGGSNYAGGDSGQGIAVDARGSAYVAGIARSADFPTLHPIQSFRKGDQDAFVTRLAPAGNALVFSTYLGGVEFINEDFANAIALDNSGNVYVTGGTGSYDFPVTPGAFKKPPVNDGGTPLHAAFVSKFSPAGALLYSTLIGGLTSSGYEAATGVAVDSFDNAYITGYTNDLEFPLKSPLQNTLRCSGNVCSNAFVTEVNPTGTGLIFSTYFGGRYKDSGNAISVNAQGNIYIAGFTTSPDFPVKNGFQRTLKSNQGNAFVAKFAPAGTGLLYSTFLGGSSFDSVTGIVADRYGNAYVTGLTKSSDFPLSNPFKAQLNTFQNAFVAKLDAIGCRLIYSSYLGGSGQNFNCSSGISACGDSASGIALDSQWRVYVTGTAVSQDFPVTANSFQTKLKSPANAFVTRISAR